MHCNTVIFKIFFTKSLHQFFCFVCTDIFTKHFLVEILVIHAIGKASRLVQEIGQLRRRLHRRLLIFRFCTFYSGILRNRLNQFLRQELLEARKQNLFANRLCNIIRETFIHVLIFGVDHSICGKHHDRCIRIRTLCKLSHLAERFDTIHHRHHVIQEYNIVVILFNEFQGFGPIDCRINLNLGIFEKARKNLQVHLHVVSQKNSCIRRNKFFVSSIHNIHLLLVQLIKIA